MTRAISVLALVTCLVLTVAGLEVLAQNASPADTQQLRIQKELMSRQTIQGQTVSTGQKNGQVNGAGKGKQAGPADGTGNKGSRPKDGSGYGSNSGQKNGPQDGTGPRCGNGGRNNSGGGKGRRGG